MGLTAIEDVTPESPAGGQEKTPSLPAGGQEETPKSFDWRRG